MCIASAVTTTSVRSTWSSKGTNAVISLDFASTATCPRVTPVVWSTAASQARRATVGAPRAAGALAVYRHKHQSIAVVVTGCAGAHPGGQHRIEQIRVHPEHDSADRGHRGSSSPASEPPAHVFVQVTDPFGDLAGTVS